MGLNMIYFGNCVFLLKLQFLFCVLLSFTLYFFLFSVKKYASMCVLPASLWILDRKKYLWFKKMIRPEKVFKGIWFYLTDIIGEVKGTQHCKQQEICQVYMYLLSYFCLQYCCWWWLLIWGISAFRSRRSKKKLSQAKPKAQRSLCWAAVLPLGSFTLFTLPHCLFFFFNALCFLHQTPFHLSDLCEKNMFSSVTLLCYFTESQNHYVGRDLLRLFTSRSPTAD